MKHKGCETTEMINKCKMFWLLNKFSSLVPYKLYREHSEESGCGFSVYRVNGKIRLKSRLLIKCRQSRTLLFQREAPSLQPMRGHETNADAKDAATGSHNEVIYTPKWPHRDREIIY